MKKFLLSLLFLAFIFIIGYLSMPALLVGNPAIMFIGALVCFAGAGLYHYNKVAATAFITIGTVFFFVMILSWIVSWRMFNAEKYYKLIGEVKVRDFEKDVSPIDQSKIIVIDYETAARLGEKTLVADSASPVVGSQVVIGEYTLQRVGKEFYYVAPTLHKSYWKYRRNKGGTPGYIMVNAVNEKDVKYVNNYKIQYQPKAFFNKNLKRHLYANGYFNVYMIDYSFEVDDNFRPFWVITTYDRTIGISGKEANGCIVVDAETGEISNYSIEETPDWVDRMQPVEFVKTQLHDWGDLVEGYFNFQELNKKRMTDGIVVSYGQDDRCYYYTGVTSTGSDGATIGFITVDSRTKEVVMYRKSGATEDRAMKSAEGAVQEKGYKASFPRTYNIHGIPTYVMGLKDKEGLIKSVAMVSVQNYETVAVGETVAKAMRTYKSKLGQFFSDLALSENENIKQVQTKVLCCNIDNGISYLHLEEVNKIIVVYIEKFPEASVTKEGHDVFVTYFESEDIISNANHFDNLNLNFYQSEQQKILNYRLNNPAATEKDMNLIPNND